MKRGDAFPSKYLSKEDVPQPIAVTIARIYQAEIEADEGAKTKVVAEFNGIEKNMIVNATNWDTLEAAYGPESDNWTGKGAELYVDPNISFGGKKVGGLRLRIKTDWTLAEAIAAAGEANMTEQDVKDIVKAAGGKGWVASRDTPLIKSAIEEARNPV